MKIGIDAGGTKTLGILYKENQAIDSVKGEMGNPIVNFDIAVNNVVQVIENLLLKNKLKYSNISHISIGMAGASTLLPELTSALKEKLQCNFSIESDLKMSHIATFKNKDGNLFIAGTGSSLLCRKNGQFIQKGGWGHILGDEGSGYWIGKQILKTYINFLDYNESPMDFLDLLPTIQQIFPNRQSIINTVYNSPKTEVAKLATLYLDYTNNLFLVSIAQQAGKDIAKALLSCNQENNITVAFEGSVIKNNSYVLNSVLTEIKSHNKTLTIISSRPANESVFYF